MGNFYRRQLKGIRRRGRQGDWHPHTFAHLPPLAHTHARSHIHFLPKFPAPASQAARRAPTKKSWSSIAGLQAPASGMQQPAAARQALFGFPTPGCQRLEPAAPPLLLPRTTLGSLIWLAPKLPPPVSIQPLACRVRLPAGCLCSRPSPLPAHQFCSISNSATDQIFAIQKC